MVYRIRRQRVHPEGEPGSIAYRRHQKWWSDSENGWTDVWGYADAFNRVDAHRVARALRVIVQIEEHKPAVKIVITRAKS